MTDIRKISELHGVPELDDELTQFLAIDKSVTDGADASDSGKTSRVKLWQIREALALSGEKGSRGESGESGTPGKPGTKGQTGESGPRGIDGQDGDGGPAGQDGENGIQGIQGIQGPRGFEGEQGPLGPKGFRGADGRKGSTSSVNDTLSLTKSDSLSWDSTKNKISKLSNGGAWNAQVFSNVGFATFNLAFAPGQNNKYMFIGISVVGSPNLHQVNHGSVFLGFLLKNNGTFDVLHQGAKINKDSFPYSSGSVFNLSWDQVNFTITLDGKVTGSFGFKEESPSYVYAFDSSFHDTGTNLTEFISFTPGANAITGPQGRQGEPGPKGQRGTPSTVKGPQGVPGTPSTVKGPRGAASTVKGPQGAASTVKGPRGPASTVKGPVGPKGPQGPSGVTAWKSTSKNFLSNYHIPRGGKHITINVHSQLPGAIEVCIEMTCNEQYLRYWNVQTNTWQQVINVGNNVYGGTRLCIPLGPGSVGQYASTSKSIVIPDKINPGIIRLYGVGADSNGGHIYAFRAIYWR